MLLIAAANLIALQLTAASGTVLPVSANANAPQAAVAQGAAIVGDDLNPPAKPVVAAIPFSDSVVKQGVKDFLAAEPALAKVPENVHALSADDKYRIFDAQFHQAKIPDCLHSNALKFNPAQIGQLAITDEFALPWWFVTVFKGLCK